MPVILIAPEFLGSVSIYLSLCIAYSECEITAHNGRTSNSQFPWRSFTGAFLLADPLSLYRTRILSREKSRFRITLVPRLRHLSHRYLFSHRTSKETHRDAGHRFQANDRSPKLEIWWRERVYIPQFYSRRFCRKKIFRDIFGASLNVSRIGDFRSEECKGRKRSELQDISEYSQTQRLANNLMHECRIRIYRGVYARERRWCIDASWIFIQESS